MEIRKMKPSDWDNVSQIYAEGIESGIATFEQSVPTYESWDQAHVEQCRLIAEEKGAVLGWAALSPVSSRCVYGGVAEVSVYIGKSSRGKGVGTALLKQLATESEQAGFWTIQSGVFPENEASINLHKKAGFRFMGKRERIGKTKDGIWKDNLLFEKRSKTIGI